MYRQGDILFVPIRNFPPIRRNPISGELMPDKIIENGIVAEGEVTGHNHVVEGAAVFERRDSGNIRQMYVHAEITATITHPEHATIFMDPGFYRVVRQREYTGNRASRQVYD